VEKGVFECTIDLFLDSPSKKGWTLCRKDLQALEIREELHPEERLNRSLTFL
jgi:hypothetical protein